MYRCRVVAERTTILGVEDTGVYRDEGSGVVVSLMMGETDSEERATWRHSGTWLPSPSSQPAAITGVPATPTVSQQTAPVVERLDT